MEERLKLALYAYMYDGDWPKIAAARNCDLADVNFHDADGFYADVSYSGIVGSLFGSSHMGVSAILVPRENIAK